MWRAIQTPKHWGGGSHARVMVTDGEKAGSVPPGREPETSKSTEVANYRDTLPCRIRRARCKSCLCMANDLPSRCSGSSLSYPSKGKV